MKKLILFAAILLLPVASPASEPSLDDALNSLNLPDNRAPVPVSREKLYSVQTRYSSLRHAHELLIGGGRVLIGESFLISNQIEAAYRFHFSDRMSIGVSGAKVYNSLSGSGQRLLAQEGRLPDMSYLKNRIDLTVMRNNFYGKFRLSMDRVFYFDQFIALGAGYVGQERGNTPAAVADVGMAFWFGHRGSVRFGFKDYYYQERRELSQGMTHNLTTYLNVGLLLGGDRT